MSLIFNIFYFQNVNLFVFILFIFSSVIAHEAVLYTNKTVRVNQSIKTIQRIFTRKLYRKLKPT